MRSSQRSELIARYLDGRMDAGERGAFERLARTDTTLGRELRAEQMIRGAIRREVAALPGEHAASRAKLMASLSELPRTTPTNGSGPSTPASGASPTSGWVTTAVGAVIIGGAALGIFLMDQAGNDSSPARPAETRAVARDTALAPAPSAPTGSATPATRSASRDAASPVTPAAPSAARSAKPASGTDAVVRADVPAREPSASPATSDDVKPSHPVAPSRPRDLRVLTNDSVKVKMRVEGGGR